MQDDQAAACAIRLIAGQVGALSANSTYFGTGDIAVMINPATARILVRHLANAANRR